MAACGVSSGWSTPCTLSQILSAGHGRRCVHRNIEGRLNLKWPTDTEFDEYIDVPFPLQLDRQAIQHLPPSDNLHLPRHYDEHRYRGTTWLRDWRREMS
jgi:hypothetical protein